MFLLSQNDENQSENGSKNSKIRLRARPPAEPQKKMLQTKKLRSKSWKTRGFFTFRLPILDGRVHEQVSSVLFFTVFFEGERHDLSKTGGFGRKMGPPPGKPVTFYECHPDDHAPAPSVRADFFFAQFMFVFVSACADLVYWNLYSGIHGCYIGYYISSKLNWKAGFQSNLIILSELSWYLLQVTILFFAHFLSLCHFSRISAAVKVFIA